MYRAIPCAQHEQARDKREREVGFDQVERRTGERNKRKGPDAARTGGLLAAEKFFERESEEERKREKDRGNSHAAPDFAHASCCARPFDVTIRRADEIHRRVGDAVPKVLVLEMMPEMVLLHVASERRDRIERDVRDVMDPLVVQERADAAERQARAPAAGLRDDRKEDAIVRQRRSGSRTTTARKSSSSLGGSM